MNYEWVQICSSTYCHYLSSTLTQCVFACVCVHILSVTSGVISTAIIIHGQSAVKSWRLHSHMSRTKMQSSTFVMSCSGIIYHHRVNKGIALLHECGHSGTECVRVTLRTTCTNYLKTQQSTDRTQTSHHATFQASSCGNILVVQASTKSSLNGNASHSFLCAPLRVLVWYWLFPVLKASYFTVRQRRRWPSHLSVMVCDWHDCCAVSVCLSASFYSTAASLIPSLSACFPTLVF